MKHEFSVAFVGMVIPATDWWRELPPIRKAALALVTTLFVGLSLGAGAGAWGAQAFDVPQRLTAVEAQIDTLTAEHTEIASYREENTCMLKRLMCRLDGGTANGCDLRFAVRAGKCPVR